jgi:glutamyl/glutaminyl-tRNA synthetase
MDTTDLPNKPTNFILEAVAEDLKTGRFNYVRTRLPPEPNGYLHIGHVKAFLIDYNTAKEFGGELILRFDDTNPTRKRPSLWKPSKTTPAGWESSGSK